MNTIKAWLSVLEATYQVIVLRPYFANVGKRLVKTAKVYCTDVGTFCYLAGLRGPEHAAAGPMGGAIMETAVLSEIVKTLTHRGVDPRVYFWRTCGNGSGFRDRSRRETGAHGGQVVRGAAPGHGVFNQESAGRLQRDGVARVRGASG